MSSSSPRGRKPAPDPVAPADELNREALAADSAALTVIGQRQSEIAERFGDGLPYERARVVNEAKFFMATSAEAMLELGKRLIQIKENEPHGEFMVILRDRLTIEPRTAQLMMQAAAKYLSPALAANAKTFSHLGKAKLLDLMTEPDEELQALAAGGTLAGLELDEVEAMSVRELREALRAEKAGRAKDNKAKQKVIDGKAAKLTELEVQLARRDSAEPGEREAAQLEEMQAVALEAEVVLRRLVGTAARVLAIPASDLAATAARHATEYAAQLFAQLLREAGITVDFDEAIEPIHLGAAGKAAAKRR